MRNIMILAAAIMVGCGDKEEDTGSDTAEAQDTDDGGEPEDTGGGRHRCRRVSKKPLAHRLKCATLGRICPSG